MLFMRVWAESGAGASTAAASTNRRSARRVELPPSVRRPQAGRCLTNTHLERDGATVSALDRADAEDDPVAADVEDARVVTGGVG